MGLNPNNDHERNLEQTVRWKLKSSARPKPMILVATHMDASGGVERQMLAKYLKDNVALIPSNVHVSPYNPAEFMAWGSSSYYNNKGRLMRFRVK